MSTQTTALRTDFVELYAVPGEGHIIDAIHPVTGLTCINAQTEAEVLARYPAAVRMTWDAWQQEKILRQQTPLTFTRTSKAQYHDLLNCLPPAAWRNGAFLVGEADDHCAETGRPRFRMYRERGSRYYVSSRPVTVKEFNRETS